MIYLLTILLLLSFCSIYFVHVPKYWKRSLDDCHAIEKVKSKKKKWNLLDFFIAGKSDKKTEELKTEGLVNRLGNSRAKNNNHTNYKYNIKVRFA